MRSITLAFIAAAIIAASPGTAAAMPADSGPAPAGQGSSVEPTPVVSPPADSGLEPLAIVLLAAGGFVALGTAGLAGARIERRVHGAGHSA
jgi:hypothetical protein